MIEIPIILLLDFFLYFISSAILTSSSSSSSPTISTIFSRCTKQFSGFMSIKTLFDISPLKGDKFYFSKHKTDLYAREVMLFGATSSFWAVGFSWTEILSWDSWGWGGNFLGVSFSSCLIFRRTWHSNYLAIKYKLTADPSRNMDD